MSFPSIANLENYENVGLNLFRFLSVLFKNNCKL